MSPSICGWIADTWPSRWASPSACYAVPERVNAEPLLLGGEGGKYDVSRALPSPSLTPARPLLPAA
jgi:hypothetical protein